MHQKYATYWYGMVLPEKVPLQGMFCYVQDVRTVSFRTVKHAGLWVCGKSNCKILLSKVHQFDDDSCLPIYKKILAIKK